MYAGQKSVRGGIQDFLCPFTDMYIAQGSGGSYSHKGTMANDVRGAEAGVRYPYYAPCDVECIWTLPSFGEAMWRSTTKVRFANGNIDYATFMTAHDDSFDATVGQIVPQGTQLGNMGTKSPKGDVTGVHCHIEIAQHWYDASNWQQNQYGNWCFPDETDTDDCYFVNDTNIIEGYGGSWKKLEDVPVKEEKNITPIVEKDEYKDQIEVKASQLRVRIEPSLNAEAIGHANIGFYNYLETKDNDGYTWYRISDNNWIAYNEEWENVYPAKPKEEFIQLKVLDKKDGYVLVDLGKVWIKK